MRFAARGAMFAIVAASSPAAFGCNPDECTAGARECDGNVARTCVTAGTSELGGVNVWDEADCGLQHCVIPSEPSAGGAFCALDPAPDPACPPELREAVSASRCIDGDVVRWRAGYRIAVLECDDGACIDQTTSMTDTPCPSDAFCSPLADPDPLCADGLVSVCDGESTLVYCACGYRQRSSTCEPPTGRCVDIENGAAGCRE